MRLALSSYSTQQQSILNSQQDPGVTVQIEGPAADKTLQWNKSQGLHSMLNLISRTLPPHTSTSFKGQFYLSLRSHLTYCSQLLRLRINKDILNLERIQRATKYLLSNNQIDYKSRLTSLHLLSLMLWLELQDIMFLVSAYRANYKPRDCQPSIILHPCWANWQQTESKIK